MLPLPRRPRLGHHVLARRHLVDGVEKVVLHDRTTGHNLEIGSREWALLASADGTRDVEGVILAAAREGAHARREAVEQFLGALHERGMIEDGLAPAPATAAEDAGAEPEADRALDVLPDFSLHCDGSGSCCRLYATVIFGPLETARARSLVPRVLDGGARYDRVFMPEQGPGPTGGAAVALVDGRCAYLDRGGRCSIHAAGGEAAKPLGCRLFPASFVDDGEAVRVSVAVECACVLASVGRPGGAPLLPQDARSRRDLDETLVVTRLPPRIAISPAASADRADVVAWSRRTAARLPFADSAAALFALAGAIERGGLDAEPISAPLDAGAVRPWVEAVARRAARRAAEDASFRSERDLARRAGRWIAVTAEVLAEPGALEGLLDAPVPAPEAEHFYLRANLHGHGLLGRLPLSLALRDRAVRLLLARVMPLVLTELPPSELDPSCAEPLALVEAMMRGHGLEAYAYDLG